MFLNKGGRILYDSLIYRQSEDSFLLEIDASVASQVVKHLKIFRVRRKIDIEQVEEKKVWVVWRPGDEGPILKVPGGVEASADPRLKNLGNRVILEESKGGIKAIEEAFGEETEESSFRCHRYRLGIGEGPIDFPYEKSFPLEGNLDFLNGVSFHKGCYVGQELTARTHHTGVVRKRLMPLKFQEPFDEALIKEENLEIKNEKGQNLGKLRGYCNGYGLALLRIEPSLASKELIIANTTHKVTTHKPKWWPTDPQINR